MSPASPPFPSPSSHRFHCSCRFLPPSADSAHPFHLSSRDCVCPVYPQQTPTVDVRGVTDHGNKLRPLAGWGKWHKACSAKHRSRFPSFFHTFTSVSKSTFCHLKSDPPHCISLLNAFPQSFSTVPHPEAPLSVLHIATRKNKQRKKRILLHHQNATETVTDEGALWLFSASDYSHDTSVKTCERPVLVRISV